MMIKYKMLFKIIIGILLFTIFTNTSNLSILAKSKSTSLGINDAIEVGDIYHFKFDSLKYDESSTKITYFSDNLSSIDIYEGDTIEIEIKDIILNNVTQDQSIVFLLSVEGSDQEQIELKTEIELLLFDLFFVTSGIETYESIISVHELYGFDDAEEFIEGDRFYQRNTVNNDYVFEEYEIVISKGLVSCYSCKYSKDSYNYQELDYHYTKIDLLDYPPIHASGDKEEGLGLTIIDVIFGGFSAIVILVIRKKNHI